MSNKQLAEVFAFAEKHHRDLILRDTFRRRYPMPEGFYEGLEARIPRPVEAAAS